MALIIHKQNLTCPYSTGDIPGARNGGSDFRTITKSTSSRTDYVGLIPSIDGYSTASQIQNVRFNAQMRVTNGTDNGTITGASSALSCTALIGSGSMFNYSGDTVVFVSSIYTGTTQSEYGTNYSTTWKDVGTSVVDESVSASDISFGARLVFSSSYGLSHSTRVYVRNARFSYDIYVRNYVTFTGDGVTTTTAPYDHGSVPTFQGTASKLGYHLVGWKSSTDGNVYTTLPACNGYDVTYTAVWEIDTYQTTITASVLELNSARTGIQSISAPSGVSVTITNDSNDAMADGSSVAYGAVVRFHAPLTYTQGSYNLTLSHYTILIGDIEVPIGTNDERFHNGANNTCYVEYAMGSAGLGATSVTVVYEQVYTVTVLENPQLLVHTDFDATDRSTAYADVVYSRRATQLAASNGDITLTVTNTNGYGIRPNGNGSIIPVSCVIGGSSELTDRVTTWTISPADSATAITFATYELVHSLTININNTDALSRVTLSRNNASVSLSSNAFSQNNGMFTFATTVNDGDVLVYTENHGGASIYDTTTTFATSMSPSSRSENYVTTYTFSPVADDLVINIVAVSVTYSVSATSDAGGTISISSSPTSRTGNVTVSISYPSAYQLVNVTDALNGTIYSISEILDGASTHTNVVRGQNEEIYLRRGSSSEVSVTNVVTIHNIQQNHMLNFVLLADPTQCITIGVYGSEHVTTLIDVYSGQALTPSQQYIIPPNETIMIRRDANNRYGLTLTPDDHYIAIGCMLDLTTYDYESGDDIDNIAEFVFTTNADELNSHVAALMSRIPANDEYAYYLDIGVIGLANKMYLSDASQQMLTQHPKALWYISKDGSVQTPIHSVFICTPTGRVKEIYGIDVDIPSFVAAYQSYLNTLT